MYGAFWCSHCEDQKETFGAGADIPYVECFPDGWKRGRPSRRRARGRTSRGFPRGSSRTGRGSRGRRASRNSPRRSGSKRRRRAKTPPRNSTRSWDSKRSLYFVYGAPPNAPRSERGIRRTRRTRGPSRRDGDYGSLELSYSVCTRVTPTRLLFATRREGPRGTRRFRLYPATTLFTSSTVQNGDTKLVQSREDLVGPGECSVDGGARRDAARSDEVRPDAAEAKSTASTPRRHPRRIEHRSRRRLIRHCCPSPPTPTPPQP